MNLSQITHIITHANCADGRASAMILHTAIPGAKVTELSYGTPEYLNLKVAPGLLFCDLTPPRERVAEFVTADAVVLDHHKGAEDIVAAFRERGVFADEPGVSGAMLALRHGWVPLRGYWNEVYQFAKHIGVRDTWQRSHPDWDVACEVSEALRFLSLEDLLSMEFEDAARLAYDLGPHLLEAKMRASKTFAATAKRVSVHSRMVAIVPTLDTSDVADLLPDVDMVAGFAYTHDSPDRIRLGWSLRSRGDLDVSVIAKRYGGGGHTQAAGFSVLVDPQPGLDPYAKAVSWMREALAK